MTTPNPPTLFATIRAALEAAAKEQADWAAIEAWRLSRPTVHSHYAGATPAHHYLDLFVGRPGDDDFHRESHVGATRLEALSAAATWCKKEMGQNG